MRIPIAEAISPTSTAKECAFVLLSEGPRTITEIHRETKKRFRKSISYPAALKAVRELERDGCVERENKQYRVREAWVREQRAVIERLYRNHCIQNKRPTKSAMSKDVTVYTVPTLYELDRVWGELLRTWAQSEPKDKRNVWTGKHCWWFLSRLHDEDVLHDEFAQYGVNTFNLLTEETLLDKAAVKYYQERKTKSAIVKRATKTDEHVAAFGDMVIRFTLPRQTSVALDHIYADGTTPIDFKAIVTLFRKPVDIELTVFRDAITANAIKHDIISKCN